MATDKVHLRHCILYELYNKEEMLEACRNLLKVFNEGTVSDRTEDGTKNLKQVISTFLISHVLGRPSLIDDDVVKAMLGQDPFPTTSEIAERLNSAQQTIFLTIFGR